MHMVLPLKCLPFWQQRFRGKTQKDRVFIDTEFSLQLHEPIHLDKNGAIRTTLVPSEFSFAKTSPTSEKEGKYNIGSISSEVEKHPLGHFSLPSKGKIWDAFWTRRINPSLDI